MSLTIAVIIIIISFIIGVALGAEGQRWLIKKEGYFIIINNSKKSGDGRVRIIKLDDETIEKYTVR